MGVQIWPCCKKVKGQPMTIFWTNLVDLEAPMLYNKIQPQSFLGPPEDLPYMVMVAILFNDAEPFKQIVNTLLIKSPMWNLVKLTQAVSETKTFKQDGPCGGLGFLI